MSRKELIVPLDQYPHGFSLGPNPREPTLRSPVAKDIQATLKENGANFHLLNRGITIVEYDLEYDSKTQKVRLTLAEIENEERFFGILDGGNTDAQIKRWREELADDQTEELASRHVNVQVLIPKLNDPPHTSDMEALLNDIKEARNNSVQVKSKSLADARRHFEVLKDTLKNEPYFASIAWHEGQTGSIDALHSSRS